MKTVAKSGLKVRSTVKAGGLGPRGDNHNRAGLKVRSSVKAGGLGPRGDNHNRAGLKVRSSIKAGKHELLANHSRRVLAPRV